MRKPLIAFALLAVAVAGLAAAQGLGTQTPIPKPVIRTIGLMGQGIAVSADDPANFEVVKAGIAKVGVNVAGQTSLTAAGVFFLGEERFLLKGIVMGNQSISADAYSGNQSIGSLSLGIVVKPKGEVWYGKLSINNASYSLYILGFTRSHTPEEKSENIKELCETNPATCTGFKDAKGIGNTCADLNATDCRDKITEFCQQNPDDERCQSAGRVYCASHLDDSRCRESMKEYCSGAEANQTVCNRLYTNYRELQHKELQQEKREINDIKERIKQDRELAKQRAGDLRERLKERMHKDRDENGNSGQGENETKGNGSG